MKSHSPWWVVTFVIVAVLALLIFVSRRQAADYQSRVNRAATK